MSEGYCIDADNKFIGKFALTELLPVPRQSSLEQTINLLVNLP